MVRKLFLILLIGMGGQLAGMEPPIEVDLKIDELVKKAFAQDTYPQLYLTHKLARILNLLLDINQLLRDESQVFETCPELQDHVVKFNRYIDSHPDLLKGIYTDPSELKNQCLYFLEYASTVRDLFAKKCPIFNSRWYGIAIRYLEDVSISIILTDLTSYYNRKGKWFGQQLVPNMEMITRVLGFASYFSAQKNIETYTLLLNPIIAKMKDRIQKKNVDDALIKEFREKTRDARKYIRTERSKSYDQLVKLYALLAAELIKENAKQKEVVRQSLIKGSAATPPPPSKIAQLRAWVNSNRLKAAGVTATIAAAGYAVYRWFTGKPATK